MNIHKTTVSSIDKELLEILNRMNKINKTFIVGGHLRNLFYQKKETDVDFLTKLTLDELKNLFPRLTFTERGLEFGVCRVQYKNRQFDFSLCDSDEDFNTKLIERDFTVNSLYSDGKDIFYPGDSLFHLQNKILSEAYSIEEHFLKSDKQVIRTYRLISEFGFSPDKHIKNFLERHKETLNDIHHSMLVDETYRLLKGEYVLKALKEIWGVYFFEEPNSFLQENFSEVIPMIGDNIKARLIFIDWWEQNDLMPSFLELMGMQETLPIDFEESKKHLEHSESIPPHSLSLYLLVKRYQTKDDPKELAKFLSSLKKKK